MLDFIHKLWVRFALFTVWLEHFSEPAYWIIMYQNSFLYNFWVWGKVSKAITERFTVVKTCSNTIVSHDNIFEPNYFLSFKMNVVFPFPLSFFSLKMNTANLHCKMAPDGNRIALELNLLLNLIYKISFRVAKMIFSVIWNIHLNVFFIILISWCRLANF